MISTVTTSTVSTVTTVAIAESVALVGVLVLFVLLFQKELTTTAKEGRLKELGKALSVGIVPLLIAFIALAASRVIEVLQ